MTPEQLLRNEDIFFANETINGIECSIGYVKKFKFKWVATQLNTFIIIGKTDEQIDARMMEHFSTACYNYALQNNRGWPRGLQAGVGSIAILQGSNIDESAIRFCEHFSKKHWSAFEIPVLYRTTDGKMIKYRNTPLFGAIYFPYFTETIHRIKQQLQNENEHENGMEKTSVL